MKSTNLLCYICVSDVTDIFQLNQWSAGTLCAALARQEALTFAWLPFEEKKKKKENFPSAPQSLVLFS